VCESEELIVMCCVDSKLRNEIKKFGRENFNVWFPSGEGAANILQRKQKPEKKFAVPKGSHLVLRTFVPKILYQRWVLP
jgi:hypothetical protein